MKKTILFFMCCGIIMMLTSCANKTAGIQDLAVKCQNGIFKGVDEETHVTWKGIPFAKPPVGELRFKAPVKPDDSNEIFVCDTYAKKPLQPLASMDEVSEDCLYLNIYTKNNGKQNKPVMVWIHGGAYLLGGTSEYPMDSLAKEYGDDMVFVNIEYRLGVMGFGGFDDVEGGEAYKGASNNGLLDQIRALEWIHENIKGFGGDAGNVTIFGESAGGGSVSLLPIVLKYQNRENNLFRRVIAESGNPNLAYTPGSDKAMVGILMEETGSKTMDDLIATDTEDIQNALLQVMRYNPAPAYDGIVLPGSYAEALELLKSDEILHLDWMLGSNEDECRFIAHYCYDHEAKECNTENLDGYLEFKLNQARQTMSAEDNQRLDEYISKLNIDKAAESGSVEGWKNTGVFNAFSFFLPTYDIADLRAEKGVKTYLYFFKPESASSAMGAAHGVEVFSVFNEPKPKTVLDATVEDNITLSRNMSAMWVNFAKNGVPVCDAFDWSQHPYTKESPELLIIEKDGSMKADKNIHELEKEYLYPLFRKDPEEIARCYWTVEPEMFVMYLHP